MGILNKNFNFFKLEIGFSSNKKGDAQNTKIAHIHLSWNEQIFSKIREPFKITKMTNSNLISDFLPIKKVTSQNSKIVHIHFSWTSYEQIFSKIREPFLGGINATVTRQSHHIYKGIPLKIQILNSTVTRQSHIYNGIPFKKSVTQFVAQFVTQFVAQFVTHYETLPRWRVAVRGGAS